MKIYCRLNIIDLMRNDVNIINNKRDLGGNFLKVKQKGTNEIWLQRRVVKMVALVGIFLKWLPFLFLFLFVVDMR